jgi:hypothetical protein
MLRGRNRTYNGGLIPLAGFVFTHTRQEHGGKNTASLTGAVSVLCWGYEPRTDENSVGGGDSSQLVKVGSIRQGFSPTIDQHREGIEKSHREHGFRLYEQ